MDAEIDELKLALALSELDMEDDGDTDVVGCCVCDVVAELVWLRERDGDGCCDAL